MQVQMPRCRQCVLCGDPIEGKGRIDRIYCSPSCRTLAWRIREGKRWGGRPRPDVVALHAALQAERQRAEAREAELSEQIATLTARSRQAEEQQEEAARKREEVAKENAKLQAEIEWRVNAHIDLTLRENQCSRDLASARQQVSDYDQALRHQQNLTAAREAQLTEAQGLLAQQQLATQMPSITDYIYIEEGEPCTLAIMAEEQPLPSCPAPEEQEPQKSKRAKPVAKKKRATARRTQESEGSQSGWFEKGLTFAVGIGAGVIGGAVIAKTVKQAPKQSKPEKSARTAKSAPAKPPLRSVG